MINTIEHLEKVNREWGKVKDAFESTHQGTLFKRLTWHIQSDGTGHHKENYYSFGFSGLGLEGWISLRDPKPSSKSGRCWFVNVLGYQMQAQEHVPLHRIVADFSEHATKALERKISKLNKTLEHWKVFASEAGGEG